MMMLGLGMVFFGLQLMKEGFYPLREMPDFIAWFSKFTPDSYFGVLRCCLVGALVTAIVQSSSATLGITMGLVGTGVINFETAAALVLGENIGTTVTAGLASLGASTGAKRAALAHAAIKIIGVAWITAIFPFYIGLIKGIFGAESILTTQMVSGVPTYSAAMQGVALSHTAFNIANVLLFMPFTSFFAVLLMRILPDKVHKEVPHLKFLDVRMLDTPAIGIEQSKKEILRMADNVEKMFSRLKRIIADGKADEKSENKIFHREEVLDILQKEVVEFLSNLLSGTVPHDVMKRGRIQLRMADEYESISDYITSILKLNLKMRQSGLEVSRQGKDEIMDLHNKVAEYVQMVSQAVEKSNISVISKAVSRGDAITHLVKEYRTKHLERVEGGHSSALESLIFTDILTSYRRIKDHALNVAESLAGEK